MGRFINRDPISEQGGINLYGFCGNNGVGRWDYLGMVMDQEILSVPGDDAGEAGILYRNNVQVYHGDQGNFRPVPWGVSESVLPKKYVVTFSDGSTQVFESRSAAGAWGKAYASTLGDQLAAGIGNFGFTVTFTTPGFSQAINTAGGTTYVLGPNSTARDSDLTGGGSKLPTPTQAQIDGVMGTYGRYFKFQGSDARIKQMQTLFAQAFLFQRPNGNSAIAIREFQKVVKEYGEGWEGYFRIGFGTGNELMPDGRTVSIERTGNIGNLISDEQMVVSIMHELLHVGDVMNPPRGLDVFDRHNEIYRLQNQTLYDLGLPLDNGPNKRGLQDKDKYIGPKF
jgi:hypothetical protein